MSEFKSDFYRHDVEHKLAEDGLQATESAMIIMMMVLTAVDLAQDPIPGLTVEVTNESKLLRFLIETAMNSNPRRGDCRKSVTEHKKKWGDKCSGLFRTLEAKA